MDVFTHGLTGLICFIAGMWFWNWLITLADEAPCDECSLLQKAKDDKGIDLFV